MKKIYISPSNQTSNRYCVGGTNEAVQCQAIAALIPDLLKDYDCECKIPDAKTKLADRCTEAKTWGADVYLAIHSNAGGGRGTEVLYCSTHTGAKEFAQSIYNVIAPISAGKDRGLKVRNDLYECKGPTMPSCICEMDFHDWADGANWIINNHNAIAKAYAEGLIKHLGLKKKVEEPKKEETATTTEPKKYYRVQIGAYSNKANAEKMQAKLKQAGYSAIIKYY